MADTEQLFRIDPTEVQPGHSALLVKGELSPFESTGTRN